MEADTPSDIDSGDIKIALDDYAAAQFGLEYGRPGNPELRRLVAEAERRGLATKAQLRAVAEYGDIAGARKGELRLQPRRYVKLSGLIFWVLVLVGCLDLSVQVLAAPLRLIWTVILLAAFNGGLLAAGYWFDNLTWRRYRLARRLAPALERLYDDLQGSRHPGPLRLVQ